MIHFLIAKLFFIILHYCYVDAWAQIPPPSISCADLGNSRFLQLNYSGKSGLAIFCLKNKWYAVWDLNGEAPEIVLPNQAEWPPGIVKMAKVVNVKSSRPCVIICFEASNEMAPVVRHNDKGWTINMVPLHLINPDHPPSQLIFEQRHGRLRIFSSSDGTSLTLNLPTGEELSVIPTSHTDNGLDASDADYIVVYQSVQGACLYLKSDLLNLEPHEKDLVYAPNSEPIMYSEIYLDNRGRAPPDQTFLQSGDFNTGICAAMAELAENDQAQRPLLLMKQAWLNLALCQGEEARQLTLQLIKEIPEIAKSKVYLTIVGFMQFLTQDYADSLKTLTLLPSVPEVDFWRSLCRSQLGERTCFNKSIATILHHYPPDLSDHILVKLIPHLYESRQLDALKAITMKIKPKSELAKAVVEFYHAMHVFNFEKREAGFKLLKKIAQNKTEYVTPIEFQTEAQLETYLYKHHAAPTDEIIKELDVLRTQSRGNDIEAKVCMKLIEQLDKKHDYAKIIELLQNLIQRFNKFDIALGLHQQLKEYVQKFFTSEDSQTAPVRIIGLFHKYKLMLKSHPEYEKFAENVATQLERLDLLEQSAELLTELSYQTLDPKKRLALQLKTGGLYVQNLQPDLAIKILKEIYPNISEHDQELAAKFLANAHLIKKDFEAAVESLKIHPSKENKRAIVDVYIQKVDYPQVIEHLKDYLLTLKEREDDALREVGLVQLAAAYRLQKDFKNLKSLHAAHLNFMKDRKSLNTFQMICRPKAEDLQNAQEVRDYINDAAEIDKIFKTTQVTTGG